MQRFIVLLFFLAATHAHAKDCQKFVDEFLKQRGFGSFGECPDMWGSCSFKEDEKEKVPKVQLVQRRDRGTMVFTMLRKDKPEEKQWVLSYEKMGKIILSDAYEAPVVKSEKKPAAKAKKKDPKKKLTLEEHFQSPDQYRRTYVFDYSGGQCVIKKIDMTYSSGQKKDVRATADDKDCRRLAKEYQDVKDKQRKLKEKSGTTGHLQMAKPKDKKLLYLGQFCWETKSYLKAADSTEKTEETPEAEQSPESSAPSTN